MTGSAKAIPSSAGASAFPTYRFNALAYVHDVAAGMLSATESDAKGEIALISMWVAPFARGRGVADALVEAVMGWAQEHRVGNVSLEVMEENERARAFYHRHGFVDEGLIESKGRVRPERRMVRIVRRARPFIIRSLAVFDLGRVREIDRVTFSPAEQYEDGMYASIVVSGLSIVIEVDGVVVGYAFVQMNPNTHIRSLAVHPDYRRRGYGRACLRR